MNAPFRYSWLFVGTLVVLAPALSRAADIYLTRLTEGNRLASIAIIGPIDDPDVARFKMIVDTLKSLHPPPTEIEIVVNSPGGKVIPAIKIGNIIRDDWLWTSVSDAPDARCYSSCIFILVAGAVRAVDASRPIGIHRPFFEAKLFAGLDRPSAKKKYDALLESVRSYLNKMGMAPDLYQAMIQIPSNELRDLTEEEIKAWNILGEDPAYQEYTRAQNVAKYGEEKMRAFDEYMKAINAYIGNCLHGGKSFDVCAKEADATYKNPLADVSRQ